MFILLNYFIFSFILQWAYITINFTIVDIFKESTKTKKKKEKGEKFFNGVVLTVTKNYASIPLISFHFIMPTIGMLDALIHLHRLDIL